MLQPLKGTGSCFKSCLCRRTPGPPGFNHFRPKVANPLFYSFFETVEVFSSRGPLVYVERYQTSTRPSPSWPRRTHVFATDPREDLEQQKPWPRLGARTDRFVDVWPGVFCVDDGRTGRRWERRRCWGGAKHPRQPRIMKPKMVLVIH